MIFAPSLKKISILRISYRKSFLGAENVALQFLNSLGSLARFLIDRFLVKKTCILSHSRSQRQHLSFTRAVAQNRSHHDHNNDGSTGTPFHLPPGTGGFNHRYHSGVHIPSSLPHEDLL